jgi:hypothetical protein
MPSVKEVVSRHFISKRNSKCPFCGALMWIDEKTGGTRTHPTFSNCCAKGQVVLPALPDLPPVIRNLIMPKKIENKHQEFKNLIRLYNNVLAFTHCSANVDQNLLKRTSGVYTFRISGSMHHQLPPIMLSENNSHRFAQIYFLDAERQLNNRSGQFPTLDKEILDNLQRYLIQNNPYCQIFKNLGIICLI